MAAERAIGPRRLVELLGGLHGAGPVYTRLARGVEHLLLDGRVPPRSRVPSERSLATALGVSRTTVAGAYAELRARGYLESRRGSGSRTTLPSTPLDDEPAFLPSTDQRSIDLACATVPALAGFTRAVEAAVTDLPRYTAQHGYQPHGLPELRQALADRYTERGLATGPEQVIVTSGALAALDLALHHFTGPGDRVLCEHPTYPNALRSIELAGARAVPTAVDPTGWDVAMVEATVRQANPRLAYLIPDFHNPTGHLMDDATRQRLARALGSSGTPTVVDETMVELSLDVDEDDMPRPFAAYARSSGAPVLLLGSAGKSFWGGLSIGWLRVPRSLVDPLLVTRAGLSTSTPVLDQLVLTHLMADRHAMLVPRRAELRAQRDHLAAALRRDLPDWEFHPPAGGLTLWCALPHPVTTALTALAARQDVLLAPGPRFGIGASFERFLRLPFTLPTDQIDDAVERIGWAYHAAAAGSSPQVETFVA
ncbi:MAG: aminotransferase class I/II-fold pyridoxal phosphate-dependent enzyme [Streptosporangiales bacterium]|nr:aminotransferase class I/II-fold pyridoxal phosphate-dependent enzyme [Streptosporangiales bacterium]